MSAAPDGSFVQLKRLARLRYGDSLPEQDRIEGTTPVFGSNGPIGLHTSPNTGASVIVVGRKGSFGAVHYSDRPVFAIDTTFYIDPSTSSVDLRWLYYVLLSANLNTVSQDTGVPGLSREKTHSHRVRLVSELAQRQIADYLDAETGRIDALISAKRDLQSALSMKLQALIDARVSGDREPGERSMLGSRFFETLPQSWVLARLRNVVRYRNSNVDKKMVEGAQRVRLCNYTDVYYGGYLDSSETFMEATASDEEVRRFRLRDGCRYRRARLRRCKPRCSVRLSPDHPHSRPSLEWRVSLLGHEVIDAVWLLRDGSQRCHSVRTDAAGHWRCADSSPSVGDTAPDREGPPKKLVGGLGDVEGG